MAFCLNGVGYARLLLKKQVFVGSMITDISVCLVIWIENKSPRNRGRMTVGCGDS